MLTAPRVLFLPGAGGDGDFWSPVAQRLPAGWETVMLDWPGLGDQPPDPGVRELEDLVTVVATALVRPSDLVAQSMGGVVALRVAARYPERVRRLVLVATSGGFDLAAHRAQDWRGEYRVRYPNAASWIADPITDPAPLTAMISAPTLLLWGDHDPISPLSVADQLARALPNAALHVVNEGTHSFACDLPEIVAPLIAEHLM